MAIAGTPPSVKRMTEDDQRTSLEDLMSTSPAGARSSESPPVAVLVVTSVIALVASAAVIPRLIYLLFPVPWDLLMWFFGR